MFDSRRSIPDPLKSLTAGMAVYDTNHTKIGTLSACDPQAGYFIAQKGVLFPHDLYIPLTAIARTDAAGLYLNLTKDQLRDERYTSPRPVGGISPAGAAGVAGTAGAATATTQAALRSVPTGRPADQVDVSGVERAGEAEPGLSAAPQPRLPSRDISRQDFEDITVPIREETLVANKTREQIGDVRLHRYVVQEDRTIEAPVSHEEVFIEHVTASDLPVGADVFTDKDIEVPVMGERLNLGRETHVVEEIRIHKRLVTEQQHASGKVRRERIRVEGDGQELMPSGDLLKDRELPPDREKIP